MDYIRTVDDYLHGGPVPLHRAPAAARPSSEAPLDYFINVSHLGYCQHYAGAMALMLRMAGIPARVATGFTPGGYSSRKKAWIVRDTDAHAWVEVWFDQYGWVTIDPTPSATPARSQVASLAAAAAPAPPVTPDRDTGHAGADNGAPNPISVRPELQLGSGDDAAGTTADDGGWASGCSGSRRSCSPSSRWSSRVVLFLRRPRGKTPMDRAIAEVEDAHARASADP